MANLVSNKQILKIRILELEQLQALQIAELKIAAVKVIDSISPVNMVKQVLNHTVLSPGIRSTVINTFIGMGTGFLAKKIYAGNSKNIFKKITGSAVQFLIASFVRKKIPELQETILNENTETVSR